MGKGMEEERGGLRLLSELDLMCEISLAETDCKMKNCAYEVGGHPVLLQRTGQILSLLLGMGQKPTSGSVNSHQVKGLANRPPGTDQDKGGGECKVSWV
eukprot:7469912-Pyramimonas_sp.AAC.1